MVGQEKSGRDLFRMGVGQGRVQDREIEIQIERGTERNHGVDR